VHAEQNQKVRYGLKAVIRCKGHQHPLVAHSVVQLLPARGVLPSRYPFNISPLDDHTNKQTLRTGWISHQIKPVAVAMSSSAQVLG
jgi:hypothetical protein